MPKRRAWNSTLPAPSKAMARGGALPKVNARRRKKRKALGLVYGPHHRWIATWPCILVHEPDHKCASVGDRFAVEAHHLKTVGSGGKDRNNQVPVCAAAHSEFHAHSLVEMSRRYKMSFLRAAEGYTALYDAEREREGA